MSRRASRSSTARSTSPRSTSSPSWSTPNGNGVYEGKTAIATWPFDGNFHEFAFGLLYKDGFFYLNLSVSINLGGASTVPQGSVDRGTHLKINKDTGAIEYVAGGLRTPHGIGWGPENEIFVTDNQGGWLPANKLLHIQPGKFYNHYTTGPNGQPGRFDDQRPTPPALWLPHNEIANSPSQPMLIPSGPFAGQMWIADVTYGGIQRAFLEKVEGEYQGAYFRMTQGLESGITHMALAGRRLDHRRRPRRRRQLGPGRQARLRPAEARPERHPDVRHPEDGAGRRRLQADLHQAALGRDAHRPGRQVHRCASGATRRPEPTAARRSATRSWTSPSATVSADRKVVTLKVADLKPNRVVYVRSPRPFEAQDGTKLLSTEAWYTLNKLPGYVAPVSDGLYELEDGMMTGGAKFDTEHAGFTGTGFVSGIQTAGASSVKVEVNTAKAGDYRMALHYANGPNPFQGPKKMTLIVNGTSRQITLPSTGHVEDVGLLPRHGHAQRGREHDRAQVQHGRRRQRQPRQPPARPGGHDALRGRGGARWRAARTPRPSTPATAASATSAATRTRARARRSRSPRSPTARRTSRSATSTARTRSRAPSG